MPEMTKEQRLEYRVAELEFLLSGANERAIIVMTYKNKWADRARHAEAIVRRYRIVCPESLAHWAESVTP